MFKLVSLIPIKTNFRIMKYWKILSITGTLAVMFAGIWILVRPFNKGIDFSGGVQLEIRTEGPADVEGLRNRLGRFSPQIQSIGSTGDIVSIYLAQGNKDENRMNQELLELKTVLGDSVEYRNTQIVGPKVGADLIKDSIIAVIIAVLAMSLYVGLRFQLPMATGTLLSLTHDVVLALFVVNLLGIEFGLTELAALMALAGYSINDTIVIYDRIRENMKRHKGMPKPDIIDLSLNETFSRTVLTGITTILAVASIYLFGGAVLRGFSSVILFGIFIGIYSSLFLSTSTLMLFKRV
jgi:preprotein translocase subunit SecF